MKAQHYFILGICIGFIISNWPTALWHFFWNPKVTTTSRNHSPMRLKGHWHEEIDEKTGFLYAAPGYCGVEVSCE